jgi:hypothetical protein
MSGRLLYRNPTDMLVKAGINLGSQRGTRRFPRTLRGIRTGTYGSHGYLTGNPGRPQRIRRRISRSGAGGTRRGALEEIRRIYAGILDEGRIRRLVSPSGSGPQPGPVSPSERTKKRPSTECNRCGTRLTGWMSGQRDRLSWLEHHDTTSRGDSSQGGKSSRRACPQSIVCLTRDTTIGAVDDGHAGQHRHEKQVGQGPLAAKWASPGRPGGVPFTSVPPAGQAPAGATPRSCRGWS